MYRSCFQQLRYLLGPIHLLGTVSGNCLAASCDEQNTFLPQSKYVQTLYTLTNQSNHEYITV